MEKTAVVRKRVTKGDTATEAIIPTGMIVPNRAIETGAVALWALMDEDMDSAIFIGSTLHRIEVKKSPNRRIPARAP